MSSIRFLWILMVKLLHFRSQQNPLNHRLQSEKEVHCCSPRRYRTPPATARVEGDEEVAEGGVAADDGEVEDCAESEDLEELLLGVDVLEQNEFKEVDGGVGISDREAVAVEAEEREEPKIQAWVNLENAKAEARSRKLKVSERRSKNPSLGKPRKC
ncbi:hypothetical protein GLYMA_08G225700v4 [Glycine max]|uniref:Uncharacterized protein n=1 Tax=Glycine max TaxID=3847 RepID=A0A0R0IW85_SOYBN|nr:hypothetical protein JHK85_022593 [Glycine max]KRH44691.1 hypothetical protein GLYMA_08G225700v4 [Glycine max]